MPPISFPCNTFSAPPRTPLPDCWDLVDGNRVLFFYYSIVPGSICICLERQNKLHKDVICNLQKSTLSKMIEATMSQPIWNLLNFWSGAKYRRMKCYRNRLHLEFSGRKSYWTWLRNNIQSLIQRNGHYSLTLVNFPPCDFDHFTPYFGQFSPLRLTLLPPVKWLLSPFSIISKITILSVFHKLLRSKELWIK